MIPDASCCSGECVIARHPEWSFCDAVTVERSRCHNRAVPGETKCPLHGGRRSALAKIPTADLRTELDRRPR